VKAGVDIMTFSNNISGSDLRTADMVHGVIRKMVENGEITEKRIDESFKRIMTFKHLLQKGEKQTLLWQTLKETQLELARTEQALRAAEDFIKNPPKFEKRKKRKNKK
jgi:beta-N-acetylhexosaminidase